MSKNDLQNIFILRKKTYFLRKGSSGHGEIFLTKSEIFSLTVEKHEQNIFFTKKSFFGEKFPLDMYIAVLTTRSKNFAKETKNLRSMSENDQKQYKFFYFRKGLRLNCSNGHVKISLDKPTEIFSTEPEFFSVHVENARQKKFPSEK